MTLKDKLEIGLKEDAPFRKDNLPESQVRGEEVDSGPGRSRGVPAARGDRNIVATDAESKPTAAPTITPEREG
jgi:hypothetical protein